MLEELRGGILVDRGAGQELKINFPGLPTCPTTLCILMHALLVPHSNVPPANRKINTTGHMIRLTTQ